MAAPPYKRDSAAMTSARNRRRDAERLPSTPHLTPLAAFNADHQQLVIARPLALATTGANDAQSKDTH
jgi:hypothetical protein